MAVEALSEEGGFFNEDSEPDPVVSKVQERGRHRHFNVSRSVVAITVGLMVISAVAVGVSSLNSVDLQALIPSLSTTKSATAVSRPKPVVVATSVVEPRVESMPKLPSLFGNDGVRTMVEHGYNIPIEVSNKEVIIRTQEPKVVYDRPFLEGEILGSLQPGEYKIKWLLYVLKRSEDPNSAIEGYPFFWGIIPTEDEFIYVPLFGDPEVEFYSSKEGRWGYNIPPDAVTAKPPKSVEENVKGDIVKKRQ